MNFHGGAFFTFINFHEGAFHHLPSNLSTLYFEPADNFVRTTNTRCTSENSMLTGRVTSSPELLSVSLVVSTTFLFFLSSRVRIVNVQ